MNFSDVEYSEYGESLETYHDLKNSFNTAREEGRKEGKKESREEEKITIAGKLKRQHVFLRVFLEVSA